MYIYERELNINLSDKFSIDDILAEFGDDSKKSGDNSGADIPVKKTPQSKPTPGATMILRSIDEKKKSEINEKKGNTQELTEQKIKHMKADIGDKYKPDNKAATVEKQPNPEKKSVAYRHLSEFEEEKPIKKSVHRNVSEPEKQVNSKTDEPQQSGKTAEQIKKSAHGQARVQEKEHKAGIISEKNSDKKEKIKVSINTSANMTFMDKVKQNRFLFEELTKRDFKKKYKRTVLGILWSVISPFLTFTIQYFVFGYIFNRLDSGFVVYLLTGTLMYTFFSNATTAGMFSMYSNGAILSKVKVPKALFVLSSNSAATFNFLLTLVVYFAFMIACGINFGFHLLLMLYPIICLIIFNIGMSYILSTLFVFFKDIQYLYQIFTMLLTYLSAIFYDIRSFPEDMQFIFRINPIYQYISYMRELVMQSTVPSLSHHVICLAFSLGMLGLGVFIHKKTEQKFVYYY